MNNSTTKNTQQNHFPMQKSKGMELTSNFLKQEISKIINEQLKTYHLKNKLQEELNKYSQQKQRQNLIAHKIFSFKQQEQSKRDRQIQLFQQRLKLKQEKVAKSKIVKQSLNQIKTEKFNKTLANVQQRYSDIVRQDSDIRLSKLPTTSQTKRSSLRPSYERNSFSQNSSRLNVVKSMEEELQKHKITKYLTKVEKCESRVLLKQLQNNKRRENILKKKVKCLIGVRKKNQQDMMDNIEKDYNNKMQTYTINQQKIAEKQQNQFLTQSMLKTKTIKQVANQRKIIHQNQINKQNSQYPSIIASYSNKGKENIMKKYRSQLDLNYSQQNRQKILTKMKNQQQQREQQRRMKLISQKLQKIKSMEQGEKLDEKTIAFILSMFDKNDQQYPKILQFLKSERKTYIQNMIKKEQQNNRSKKLSKNLSKLSILS